MAKRSFTYRFKVSATNEGYDCSQEDKPQYITDEIIYSFSKKVEQIGLVCNTFNDEDRKGGTFVIKREDVNIYFRKPNTFNNNKDVLYYQLRNIVSNYLNNCGVEEQDTCIVEYELIREDTFSTDEYISDKLKEEIRFMVIAITDIGDNARITPTNQIKAMHFEISLNYVSSEIFYKLNVRETSDSHIKAQDYLKDFIAAFFRLIPKKVIERYDMLYKEREKVRIENSTRDKEGKIRCNISPDKRESYGGKVFALVSRLIKKDLIQEIGDIIKLVHPNKRFHIESFAGWGNDILVSLEIKASSTKYDDSKTPISILSEISNKKYINKVKKFLGTIDDYYQIKSIKLAGKASAIFYKFQEVCPAEYLNVKYKRRDSRTKEEKVFKKSEFKDLCLQYFGLEPNEMRPNKCNYPLDSYYDNLYVWNTIIPSEND